MKTINSKVVKLNNLEKSLGDLIKNRYPLYNDLLNANRVNISSRYLTPPESGNDGIQWIKLNNDSYKMIESDEAWIKIQRQIYGIPTLTEDDFENGHPKESIMSLEDQERCLTEWNSKTLLHSINAIITDIIDVKDLQFYTKTAMTNPDKDEIVDLKLYRNDMQYLKEGTIIQFNRLTGYSMDGVSNGECLQLEIVSIDYNGINYKFAPLKVRVRALNGPMEMGKTYVPNIAPGEIYKIVYNPKYEHLYIGCDQEYLSKVHIKNTAIYDIDNFANERSKIFIDSVKSPKIWEELSYNPLTEIVTLPNECSTGLSRLNRVIDSDTITKNALNILLEQFKYLKSYNLTFYCGRGLYSKIINILDGKHYEYNGSTIDVKFDESFDDNNGLLWDNEKIYRIINNNKNTVYPYYKEECFIPSLYFYFTNSTRLNQESNYVPQIITSDDYASFTDGFIYILDTPTKQGIYKYQNSAYIRTNIFEFIDLFYQGNDTNVNEGVYTSEETEDGMYIPIYGISNMEFSAGGTPIRWYNILNKNNLNNL